MGVWHSAEKTIEYRFWEEGSAKTTTKKFKIEYQNGCVAPCRKNDWVSFLRGR